MKFVQGRWYKITFTGISGFFQYKEIVGEYVEYYVWYRSLSKEHIEKPDIGGYFIIDRDDIFEEADSEVAEAKAQNL